MPLAEASYSDWYVGLVIGFVVVVVVVMVVAVILTSAARIGEQVRRATDGLDAVRSSTAVLWEVRKTNAAAPAILEAARAAREAVVAKLTGTPTAPGVSAPPPPASAPPPSEQAEPPPSEPPPPRRAPPLGGPRPGPPPPPAWPVASPPGNGAGP